MSRNIVLIRNILYKCFLIGYVLTIVVWIISMQNWSADLTIKFFGGSKHDVIQLFLYIISLMKLFNIYLFLIPALALHWTGYSLKKSIKYHPVLVNVS